MKKRKGLYIATAAIVAAIAGTLVMANGGVNLTAMPLKASTSIENGTITFDGTTTTTSGSTRTTYGYTSSGSVVICKSTNNKSSTASNYVCEPQEGTEIHFYKADGVTEYNFEDLHIISFYHDSDTYFGNFNLHPTYVDGSTETSSYGSRTNNPRNLTYSNNKVAYLSVEFTANATGKVNKLVLTYNCNQKTLNGITISTQPTKTSYIEGERFDPAGMVVIANYSGSINVATNEYSYSTSPLQVGDTSIDINYGGYSQSVAITVSANTYPGTYLCTEGTTTFTAIISDDMTGSYRYYNPTYGYDATFTFTWSVSGSTITFNKTSGSVAESSGTARYLFGDTGTWADTNTGTFSGTSLKLYLISGNGSNRSSVAKTLAKQ